jgi:hypothetical protein
MKNFIEPIQGTKIAEFKLSWFKHFIYEWLMVPIYILFAVSVISLLSIVYEEIKDPMNPLWLSWTIRVIICLCIGGYAILTIIGFWLDTKIERKTKNLTGKVFSLFLVKEGIEINNEFIPYKVKSQCGMMYSDGVDSFKIDGNFLIVKTYSLYDDPFIKIYGTKTKLTENQIKFKIDSKYQDCKEELLSYLNNQIDKRNSPNLNENE